MLSNAADIRRRPGRPLTLHTTRSWWHYVHYAWDWCNHHHLHVVFYTGRQCVLVLLCNNMAKCTLDTKSRIRSSSQTKYPAMAAHIKKGITMRRQIYVDISAPPAGYSIRNAWVYSSKTLCNVQDDRVARMDVCISSCYWQVYVSRLVSLYPYMKVDGATLESKVNLYCCCHHSGAVEAATKRTEGVWHSGRHKSTSNTLAKTILYMWCCCRCVESTLWAAYCAFVLRWDAYKYEFRWKICADGWFVIETCSCLTCLHNYVYNT